MAYGLWPVACWPEPQMAADLHLDTLACSLVTTRLYATVATDVLLTAPCPLNEYPDMTCLLSIELKRSIHGGTVLAELHCIVVALYCGCTVLIVLYWVYPAHGTKITHHGKNMASTWQ